MTERQYEEVNGTSYHKQTPVMIREILENLRASQRRVVVIYGDTETGRAWGDVEFGRVSRSMGPVKVPLLIHNSRSYGGGAMLDHCIVGIRSTCMPHLWTYKHPKYNVVEDDWTHKMCLDV